MTTTILQDTSPSRIAQALDANKIAFGTLLSTHHQKDVPNDSHLCWFETGIPSSSFNGVRQIRQTSPDLLALSIKQIIAHFQQKQLPFHWSVGPTSQPENLGTILTTYGIHHDEDEPGMWVDLHNLHDNLPTAPALAIQPVTNHEQLRQWIQVWGCGAPQSIIEQWFSAYSQLPFTQHSSLRMFLGSLNGQPVATVYLFLAEGVASIEYVVTLPQFRRQGIGAAMTLKAAREARLAGYRIAVLTASPDGINIYRRIGFQECCTVSTYEWHP